MAHLLRGRAQRVREARAAADRGRDRRLGMTPPTSSCTSTSWCSTASPRRAPRVRRRVRAELARRLAGPAAPRTARGRRGCVAAATERDVTRARPRGGPPASGCPRRCSWAHMPGRRAARPPGRAPPIGMRLRPRRAARRRASAHRSSRASATTSARVRIHRTRAPRPRRARSARRRTPSAATSSSRPAATRRHARPAAAARARARARGPAAAPRAGASGG